MPRQHLPPALEHQMVVNTPCLEHIADLCLWFTKQVNGNWILNSFPSKNRQISIMRSLKTTYRREFIELSAFLILPVTASFCQLFHCSINATPAVRVSSLLCHFIEPPYYISTEWRSRRLFSRREHVLELGKNKTHDSSQDWLSSNSLLCFLSSFPPKVTQICIHQCSQKGQVKD